MGLLKSIFRSTVSTNDCNDSQCDRKALLRRCHFEILEKREVLTADPVIAGATYLENDLGQDSTPDYFEVTFQGGAETTQLTSFTIDGDQNGDGVRSDGDIFFDATAALPGTGESHDFQIDESNSSGVTADDILGVSVSDDGLVLTVDLQNFEAGDVLAFTIDVDEVEGVRDDQITSGVEFESTRFSTTFVDQNYNFEALDVSTNIVIEGQFPQSQTEGLFYDNYDEIFAEGGTIAGGSLELDLNTQNGQSDRNDGAIDAFNLVPKPVTISGNVWHDENIDCVHDSNEDGINNVEISLQKLNESTGLYEEVATTTTDLNGHYEFGEDLNLMPGVYQLVEVQPTGFIDVGAVAGTVEGDDVGSVLEDAEGNGNVITDINIPLGGTAATEYNFKEVRPASLSGNVWHDENNDGVFDPNEQGIADVLIQVTRVSGKDGSTTDAFSDLDTIFVRTDANGHYSVDALPPGIYEVVEINNYPENADPLAPFIDGKDSLGNIRGDTVGTQANDRFNQIHLCAGDDGVEYNFGEIRPSSISGFVGVASPEGNKVDPSDPDYQAIGGVEIQLFNDGGELIASTFTNESGFYEFGNLGPGNYMVMQIQPDQYVDGPDSIGNVDDVLNGVAISNDKFTNITLVSGDEGVQYNFCEHEPASIKGTVYHDRNDNGVQDDNDEGIAGVRIVLTDAEGNFVAETVTDENGEYCFEDLPPGEYKIQEFQPDGFVDGQDSVGSVDGQEVGSSENDHFCEITLLGGDQGVEYNFGEIRLASISGSVHTSVNGDKVFDPSLGEEALSDVTLELLNADGDVVATTQTNADGFYQFDNLLPGEYSIREVQPTAYFDAGQIAGDGGGDASGTNLISGINIESGQNLTEYNFCEHEAAEIHGRVFEDGPAFETEDGNVPDDYRDQRDSIFEAGVDTPLEGVRVQLYYYIDPTSNEISPRPVTLGEVNAEDYAHLGDDPTTEVWVETDENGEYWFTGLQPGNYIVLEIQPEGFVDANDVPGTTTGLTFNSASEAQVAVFSGGLSTLSTDQVMDSVTNIRVNAGGVSLANNFTEVRAVALPPVVPATVDPPPPEDPGPIDPNPPTPVFSGGNPVTPRPGLTGPPGLAGAQNGSFSQFVGTGAGVSIGAQAAADPAAAEPYTWHLSVVNGGQPRAAGEGLSGDASWLQVGFLNDADWNLYDMSQAGWTFTESDANGHYQVSDRSVDFGTFDGTPLAGDFDGDGTDEVAIYKDGYWMIDINHNGEWDNSDLLARLGDADDRPVVGDWDGDGKDDIGIYGPMWSRDAEAIDSEPGLPNPDNDPHTRPKNVPPMENDATNGARIMKLTSYGRQRADVVDHVFGTGEREDVPVTGDWNGNGIRSIGIFDNGTWKLDVNGDGQFDHADVTVDFGRAGDIPLVGDFNGDGIEDLAVYRNGTWLIDSNGNRELDATDHTFRLGGAGDKPVVGDWDGNGTDEPGLYTEHHNGNPT